MHEAVHLSIGGQPRAVARQSQRRKPVTGAVATLADAAGFSDVIPAVEAAEAAIEHRPKKGSNTRRARLTDALAA